MPTAVATPVSATTGATTARVITLTPHASTAVGDLVVVIADTTDVSASTMALPVGWDVLLGGQQSGTMRSSIWSRTWQPGDSTIDLSVSGTDGTVATVVTVTDAGTLTVGPVGLRSVTGTSTTNVAPGVTATAGDLVLLYSGERTNASEPEPTVAGFTTLAWRSGGSSAAAPAVSILAMQATADGPVPDTTITYPNSSAQNGIAILLVVGQGAPPSGGSVTDVVVSSTGGGHRRSAGASTTGAAVAPTGAGAKRALAGDVAAVGVDVSGSGVKAARGASTTGAGVTVVGAGRKVAAQDGVSVVPVGVAAVGAGHARRGGASSVAVLVEAVGAGHGPDDFELVLGPGPVGSGFALGGPTGSPFSLSTPRR